MRSVDGGRRRARGGASARCPRDGVAVLNADDAHYAYCGAASRAQARACAAFGTRRGRRRPRRRAGSRRRRRATIELATPTGRARPSRCGARAAQRAERARRGRGCARRRRGSAGGRARPRVVPRGDGPAAVKPRAATARWSSTTPTTPTPIRCARRSTCSRRAAAARCSCWATWARSARRAGVPREIGALRARRRRRPAVRGRARSARAAARAFGAGGEHFDDVDALIARAQRTDCAAGVTVLVKGSRFMRMERVVARSPVDARGGTDAAQLAEYLAKDIRAFNVFSYITLRAVLAALTALVISFLIGPAMIRWLAADEDRPVGARRRPADASRQGRHADDGRRADPGLDRGHHASSGPT